MFRRNWEDLSRKLVDHADLTATIDGMENGLDEMANSFFGEGVLATTIYPFPFVITLSGVLLGGSSTDGIAYDPIGHFTAITPDATTSPTFTMIPSDLVFPRWDLLVIRYRQVGDTPIPKPSDPLLTVNLNLHDDFQLVTIPGIPSATPAYPSKNLTTDVILGGIQVPANATLGTQCLFDLSIREYAIPDRVKLPVFKQEAMVGPVDGSNVTFTTTLPILTNGSFVLFINGIERDQDPSEYTLSGQTVTIVVPPALGSEVTCWYIVDANSSQNPLAALQEIPLGAADGVNDTYNIIGGNPANKSATIVFIDGELEDETGWTLIQTPTGSSIKMLPGYILNPGQKIYVFYFVNPGSVGIGGGGGGGGSGAYVPYGTISSPLTINPVVGIPTAVDQRQLLFVSSPGGAQVVSANPQIAPGSVIGQEMLLRGVSDTNYITLNDGNGLSLNGSINLTSNMTLPLFWDGFSWCEIARR